MEIVVKGRRVEVPARLRAYAQEKLAKVEKLCPKVIRVDVEVSRERNPRLASSCERVELTCVSAGPPIRAEAAAETMTAAFDLAWEKLESRLRKAADRRRIHHGRTPPPAGRIPPGSEAELLAVPAEEPEPDVDQLPASEQPTHGLDLVTRGDDVAVHHSGPMVVREKVHVAAPMTLDQALYQMELVGHDFYLFVDQDSGLPSVVYRRRGYDYGVIRLASASSPDGHEARRTSPDKQEAPIR
ncbi:MAG: ribosome-associated translation inhibitor RaiA [Acidothermus sp.]|nr:ribosome-associated translation inhibitor RaiA [Acidothermus sp.]MCL6537046.1 ribosome-associated translation inhibitor RaiA [Acidothermus sp.]